MNDYIETRLDFTRSVGAVPETGCVVDMETATDVMASLLCDIGYESFEPDGHGVTAFVRKDAFDDEALKSVISEFPLEGFMITCSMQTVEGQDWNREWEKNYFKPIVVGKESVIHSSFHTDIPVCTYDIVIDPKMAFGTGHHATTTLMMEALLATDCHGLSVVDMGTGTGILAILARILGAAKVLAVEIDEFAAANTAENIALNLSDDDGDAVELVRSDASALKGREESADLFLANINRNIIVADMASYSATLRTGGHLVVSGFYVADRPIVESAARAAGLVPTAMAERDNWSSMTFVKEQ